MNYKTIEYLDKISGGDFYVLKIQNFIDNINDFNKSFTKHYRNFKIGYSYKTNYIPYVCKVADELGAYAEIVSELELNIALKAGVQPRNIIYNGPVKTKDSLEYCLLNDAYINLDSLTDLEQVVGIIQKYPKRTFSIGIRLNFDFNDDFFSRFGFALASSELNEAIKLISSFDQLKLIGLHTHSTRPDKSPDIFLKKLIALIKFSQQINIQDLRYLDIGGGFFGRMDDEIKLQFKQPVFDIEDYGVIAQEMKKRFPDEDIELIIEPGVSITSNILDYYTKITDIKSIYEKKIALTTGSFHNVKPSGHKKNLSIDVYSNKTHIEDKPDVFEISGYTCLENDYLYNGYKGNLHLGDIVQIKNIGAYSVVFKPPFIKLAPPIYLIKKNKIITIREREEFSNIFESYLFK